MKSKLIQIIPLLLSIVGSILAPIGYWCIYTINVCYGTIVSDIAIGITNPLYLFSLYAIPIAIVLVFVPRRVFNSWLRFAIWAIPIAFIYIATMPVNFTGIGLDLFPFYRDDAARLASEVFSLASLAFLILSYLRNRLYDFDIKKYSKNYAISDTKDLTIIFISVIGFISTVVISLALFLNVSYKILSIETLLSIFGVSIFTNAYVLYYAIISLYKKLTKHLPMGWKLYTSIILFTSSIILYIVTFIRVITYIQN